LAAPSSEVTYPHILVAASTFFILSYWIHYPDLAYASTYSDIYNALWFRIALSHGLPYIDYPLEYPILAGVLLWFASTWHNVWDYYNTISLVFYACMLAGVSVVYRLIRLTGGISSKVTYYIIFTPSFIYFSIYSFDWMGISLLLFSIFFAFRRKALLAGGFMGLSVAARLIPIVCLPFIFKEFRSWRERSMLLGASLLGWLLPNLYFLSRNWYGVYWTYQFQASYPVEDSWLGVVTASTSLTTTHLVSALLLISTLSLIFFWRKRRFTLIEASLLAMLAFVLTGYKFPPQYLILLMPLLALNRTNYALSMIANILNTMIILLWFTPEFNLGNPHIISSPIQWIAIARQAFLLPIFLNYFRGGTGNASSPKAA
jgi:hypothetical protein